MEGKVIKKYDEKNLPKGLTIQDWNFMRHYFKHDANNPIGDVPEKITIKIKPTIPKYVDTIINFGCSNCRDLIPFQDDYKLIGFDLVPPDYMDFVSSLNTNNLTYYQCSIEDYITDFNHDDLDLSKSLVYTSATLMYLEQKDQIKFFNHLIKFGCKNMVFQEYKYDSLVLHPKFNPTTDIFNLFNVKPYRESPLGGLRVDDLYGHVILDGNNLEKFNEYKNKVCFI